MKRVIFSATPWVLILALSVACSSNLSTEESLTDHQFVPEDLGPDASGDVPDTGPDSSSGSCGDGDCAQDETCATCPEDCSACPPECGDGDCNGIETCGDCPGDCGA